METDTATPEKERARYMAFPNARTIVPCHDRHDDPYGISYHFRLLDADGNPYPYVFAASRKVLEMGYFYVCSEEYDPGTGLDKAIALCRDRGVLSWLAHINFNRLNHREYLADQTVPVRTDAQATAEFAAMDAERLAWHNTRLEKARENFRRLGRPFPEDKVYRFHTLEEQMEILRAEEHDIGDVTTIA